MGFWPLKGSEALLKQHCTAGHLCLYWHFLWISILIQNFYLVKYIQKINKQKIRCKNSRFVFGCPYEVNEIHIGLSLVISDIFKMDDISYKTILLVASIQTKRETISSHCTHCHFLLLNKTSMIFDNTCRSLDFLSSQTEKWEFFRQIAADTLIWLAAVGRLLRFIPLWFDQKKIFNARLRTDALWPAHPNCVYKLWSRFW